MPFAGGTGVEGDRFQIGTLDHWNSINDEATGSKFKLINSFSAAGQQLERVNFDDKDIDGQGYSITGIDDVNSDNLMVQGVLSNIHLDFNWSKDVNGLMSPLGLTVLGTNVKITGSITNTNASGSVAGYAERGLDGSSNVLVTADLSANSTVYGLADFSNGTGIDKGIFAGSMAGSGVFIGTQGDPDGDPEPDGSNLFWDRQVSGATESFDENAGGKTTLELQTLSTYTTLYSESYSGTCVIDGVNVSVYPGVGNADFNFSVGETVYLYGVPFEVDTVSDASNVALTTAPTSSIRTVTGDAFGTGDGTTTGFQVAENALQAGTITIRIDGTPTTAYTINEANGNVTFDTAPSVGAVLTADYDYSLEIPISQGTGTYRLTEAFDIVDISSFDGSQEWVIDDGVGYPDLGVFVEEEEFSSGAVTFNTTAFSDGTADFFSAPSPTGTLTLVDSDVAITSGVATMTTARDSTKDYFAIARGLSEDFTGTVTSVSGNDLTLPSDLSGISIGGVDDDHYIFRATGGAGSGTEVTVTARSGNTITVPDGSIFDNTTTYVFGRFVRGISKVLPKD